MLIYSPCCFVFPGPACRGGVVSLSLVIPFIVLLVTIPNDIVVPLLSLFSAVVLVLLSFEHRRKRSARVKHIPRASPYIRLSMVIHVDIALGIRELLNFGCHLVISTLLPFCFMFSCAS